MLKYLLILSLLANVSCDGFFFKKPSGAKFSYFSVVFDRVNEYIDLGNVLAFERTDAFSIVAWVKISVNTFDKTIFAKLGPHGASGQIGYYLRHSTGRFTIALVNETSGASSNRISVQTPANFSSTSVFYHIVASYDGSQSPSGFRIVVNGSNQSLETILNNLNPGTIISSAEANVGRGKSTSLWGGKIDELTVWRKKLSTTEEAQLYGNGAVVNVLNFSFFNSTDCGLYYRMGELNDSVTVASGMIDRSGNLLHGTGTNLEAEDIQTDIP